MLQGSKTPREYTEHAGHTSLRIICATTLCWNKIERIWNIGPKLPAVYTWTVYLHCILCREHLSANQLSAYQRGQFEATQFHHLDYQRLPAYPFQALKNSPESKLCQSWFRTRFPDRYRLANSPVWGASANELLQSCLETIFA